jgi:hypothetical protein
MLFDQWFLDSLDKFEISLSLAMLKINLYSWVKVFKYESFMKRNPHPIRRLA